MMLEKLFISMTSCNVSKIVLEFIPQFIDLILHIYESFQDADSVATQNVFRSMKNVLFAIASIRTSSTSNTSPRLVRSFKSGF